MKMSNYVNQQPNEQKCKDTNLTEKRVIHLIALSFGVLCMVQAILNISLRVTYSPTQTGIDGNKHKFGKKNENTDETGSKMPDHCSALVETINQVINQKNQLEEQVRQLYHRRDCLKMLLKGYGHISWKTEDCVERNNMEFNWNDSCCGITEWWLCEKEPC